jgi:uncharacterized protein YutD
VQSPSVTGQLEKKGQFKPNNETEDCVQKLDEAGEFIWRYKMWLCQHFRKWEVTSKMHELHPWTMNTIPVEIRNMTNFEGRSMV